MKGTILFSLTAGLHTLFQALLTKTILLLYRMFAIVALYGVLCGVLFYTVLMGVYAINTSWIAPVILSPSDQRSLDVTERLITTRTSLEDLNLELQRQQVQLIEMRQHRAALTRLRPALDAAIAREQALNRAAGKELARLNQQKRQDIAMTQEIEGQVTEVEERMQQDLRANLITKGEAALLRVQLNQAHNSATDGQISEVLLRDNVLQKSTLGSQVLDILDKRAELESQIAQLDGNISVAVQQIEMVKGQVERLNQAVALATQTPYFLAVSGGKPQHFAFVPYDNRTSVSVGAPVYDCDLNIVLCHYVGTVKRIFDSEEKTQNPIFRTDMRGFLVQLELAREESAKSKTLFLNHRPLML